MTTNTVINNMFRNYFERFAKQMRPHKIHWCSLEPTLEKHCINISHRPFNARNASLFSSAWLPSCMRLVCNKVIGDNFGGVGWRSGSSHWFLRSRHKYFRVRDHRSDHLEMTVTLSICDKDFNFVVFGRRAYLAATSRALPRTVFPICKPHLITMPWNK